MMFFITIAHSELVLRCDAVRSNRERERERERGLVMTIMELAAIPLWTLGIAGAITGVLALVLCAFADDSLFMPDLGRRKILIWGLVLVTGSPPCLLLPRAGSL